MNLELIRELQESSPCSIAALLILIDLTSVSASGKAVWMRAAKSVEGGEALAAQIEHEKVEFLLHIDKKQVR